MKVKVHPHRTLVLAGAEQCVSVTPVKKHGRAYYMGSVMLGDVRFVIHESGKKRAQSEQVRNVHAWAVGELYDEQLIQYGLLPQVQEHMVQVTYHYNVGRFLTVNDDPNKVVDVTDGHFKAAYFYVSEF
jgi:hypothetical protein